MIVYKNIVKSFAGKKVLNDISFTVSEGEIIFILGTSGTGKSVLLKNTVGLMKPDSGSIYFCKSDVTKMDEDELLQVRKRCGMVFQHPALFDSLSVFENIAFGLRRFGKESEQKIYEQVLKGITDVNLSVETLQKFPNEISYGMQKRVSIARTLVIKPQALLFDEPTTGLDPVTTTAVNQLIFQLSRKHKITSIVVSHDMRCALAIADRIVVLDRGRVIAEGSPEVIQQSSVPLVKDFLHEVVV